MNPVQADITAPLMLKNGNFSEYLRKYIECVTSCRFTVSYNLQRDRLLWTGKKWLIYCQFKTVTFFGGTLMFWSRRC